MAGVSVLGGAGAGAGPEATPPEGSASAPTVARFRSPWRVVECRRRNFKPPRRSGAASVVVGDCMYIFGGYGGEGRLDDFWQYHFDSRTWTRVEYSTPSPGERENNGVVEHCGKLYLFGGYNGSEWLNDFHEFDLETRAWREIEPKGDAPASRFGYVSMTHHGVFLLFGGYDGSAWLNDMHEYTFSSQTWRFIKPSGSVPSMRSCPAWTKHPDRPIVFVFGGYDGLQRMNDFYAFNLDTYTWSAITTAGEPPSPRYFHSCAYYGDCFYVFGGYNGAERLNDFHEFSFKTHQWRCVCAPSKPDLEDDVWNKLAPVPSGRSSLISQVYKNSLYCFGGYNGSKVLNDFYEYRFEPVTVPPPSLTQDLKSLINNPTLSDVTFIVDGERVYASRIHLALRCEAFRGMFFGGMRESEGATCAEIELPEVSLPVFLKLLEFVYTDTVEEIDAEIAMELLVAAERFLLDRLKSLCEVAIHKSIAVHTVVHNLLYAHRHNANNLKELCLEFIHDNFDLVKEDLTFEELRTEPELLFALLMRQSGIVAGATPAPSPTPSTPGPRAAAPLARLGRAPSDTASLSRTLPAPGQDMRPRSSSGGSNGAAASPRRLGPAPRAQPAPRGGAGDDGPPPAGGADSAVSAAVPPAVARRPPLGRGDDDPGDVEE